MVRLVPLVLSVAALARPAPRSGARAVKPPPEDTPPPVPVVLRLEAPSAEGPWKLAVVNQSSAKVRVAADGRLLRLTIAVPEPEVEPAAAPETTQKKARAKAKKPVRPSPVECALPPEMLPGGVADDRVIVLAPGARYEETFQPALYCFGERERATLRPGAQVTAHLGFALPAPRKGAKAPEAPRPPFVVEPVSDDDFSPRKELEAPPFAFPAAAAAEGPRLAASSDGPSSRVTDGVVPSAGDAGTPKRSEYEPDLVVSTPARSDAEDPAAIAVTVTVRNTGRRPALLHARRENLLFEVTGPQGSFSCGGTPPDRTIPNDLVSPLPSGASEAFDVRLVEPCPDHAFDRPGLYHVRAALSVPSSQVTRGGKNGWSGVVRSNRETLVRVRVGPLPLYANPPEVPEDP